MNGRESELVSVIVPAYNAAVTIGETLEAARAQTYTNLEIIVADDGSTDATAEIAASLAGRDPRIWILHQPNRGVAAARNLAIEHARGSYVAPLDADDLWHPEKIACQVAAIRRGGPRVGVVYCWRRLIDGTGRVITEDRQPYPHEGDVLAAVLLGNIPGNGSVPLIRRRYLMEAEGYDADLRAQGAQGCEDLMLYLELAQRCEFALVPQFLVGYRAGLGNMSSDARRISRSEAIVLQRARDKLPELPARVFRVAAARAQLRASQRYLRKGMPASALIALLDGLRRDPVAAAYKLIEKPHRLLYNPRRHLREIKGQPFLALSPKPRLDASSVSSPFLRRYAAYALASADQATKRQIKR